jgi:polysaccharide biosynthesis protein PelF
MARSSAEADVTVLLEGTYPFVRGGVSEWVHQLIEGLPEFSFSLVFLGAERPHHQEMRYKLPPNVRSLSCHYLMETAGPGKMKATEGDAAYFSKSAKFHEWFRNPCGAPDSGWLGDVVLRKADKKGYGAGEDFFFSKAAWKQISESYASHCPQASFHAYFWAVRNMHTPLLKLAAIAHDTAPSKVYHAVTTGYAGLLGAMLKQLTGRALILTEHGIYTKERKIELQAMFLREQKGLFATIPDAGMEYHNQAWLRLFEGIGRLVYEAADPIITLHEQNRQRQIHDGALPSRTRIIPNGVDVKRFKPLLARRASRTPMVLGLIGRIVPIKDIKTFIRGISVLVTKIPGVEGWLIGPEDENPAYVEECRALVGSLQLEGRVRFLGFQKVEDIIPQLGLLVLTSISEAFPLVIGESHASGLPVLATDVGACRDLIEGKEPEDRALGPAGVLIPIGDHDAMARAAFDLLTDPVRWSAAQQAGIARVERYYQRSRVIDSYREIYQRAGGE